MINIIEIKDLDAPELQIYYNLNEAQLFHYFEPKPGIFIAESPKVIERALDAGCVPMSFLMEKKHVETQAKDILARCDKLQSRDIKQTDKMEVENGNSNMSAEREIPVYTAEIEVLAKITGYQLTRGMLCAMYRPALSSVEQLWQKCKTCCNFGKCGKSNKCRSNFPFCGGTWNGCSAFDTGLCRPIVPESKPCQHGNSIPDTVDIF